MIILDYFLLNEPQFSTALFTGFFLLLSGIIGLALRRPWIVGAVWGFLILAGSADLALFISRSLGLSTSLFGILVALLCAVIVFVFRLLLFKKPPTRETTSKTFVAVVLALTVIIWMGNILHPLPDAGFSSHHGWVPLYIQESFSSGKFLNIEDMAFGHGLMTTLYYPADLLGMVALSGWFGLDEVYPAFNAGSIVATILMFALLSRSLKKNFIALIAFFVLTIVMFGFDPFFRTVLGGNWGDVLMYLGGALVCYYLCKGEDMGRALFLAAVASTFLVFARHYGAFYSAIIIAFCFVVSWAILGERKFKPWLAIGVLGAIFSARELYYLLGRFTQYYPGSWQMERAVFSKGQMFSGTLTDWGIFDASNISMDGLSIRALYVVVLAIVLWRLLAETKNNKLRIVALLAPLVVLAAPLTLQVLTGYRTNSAYSKLYILGVFIFAWYPAFLLTHLNFDQPKAALGSRFRLSIIAGTVMGVVLLGWAASEKIKPARVVGTSLEETLANVFKDNIVDRGIAAALRSELSANEMLDVINRPVMYVYFEPGASLRLYLGGDFLKDLDFWSVPVNEQIKNAESFENLLFNLGYPNLYIGLMPKGEFPNFGIQNKAGIVAEIESYKTAPWLDRVVEYGDAKFFIVRRPNS